MSLFSSPQASTISETTTTTNQITDSYNKTISSARNFQDVGNVSISYGSSNPISSSSPISGSGGGSMMIVTLFIGLGLLMVVGLNIFKKS